MKVMVSKGNPNSGPRLQPAATHEGREHSVRPTNCSQIAHSFILLLLLLFKLKLINEIRKLGVFFVLLLARLIACWRYEEGECCLRKVFWQRSNGTWLNLCFFFFFFFCTGNFVDGWACSANGSSDAGPFYHITPLCIL